MTRQQTSARAAQLDLSAPAYLGRFDADGVEHDFFMSVEDVERDTEWLVSLMPDYGIGRGSHVVFTTAAWHACWYEAFREAVRRVGGVVSNSEIFDWDAKRLDMFLRRLPVHALIGSPSSLIRAFESLVDTVAPIGQIECLLVEPTAVAYLREFSIAAGTVARVGPVLLVSALDGSGLRFNEQEWQIDSDGGQLVVTSRKSRETNFESIATGVRGTVLATADGARIQLDSSLLEDD